ncbi:MAG: hypothetical protein ACI85O_002094 [Saprospiraceae bacterium]|jgi:hypothetical protein
MKVWILDSVITVGMEHLGVSGTLILHSAAIGFPK